MANRTSPGLVQAVLRTRGDYRRNDDLGPYCDVANTLVNRLVTTAGANGQTLTDDELKKIETWLGAWAYKQSDLKHATDSDLGASATYQGKTDMNFASNNYGQTAMMLDWTGTLRAMSEGVILDCGWAGIPRQKQPTYEQRGN